MTRPVINRLLLTDKPLQEKALIQAGIIIYKPNYKAREKPKQGSSL